MGSNFCICNDVVFCREIDGNVYLGEIKEKEVVKNIYENVWWMG